MAFPEGPVLGCSVTPGRKIVYVLGLMEVYQEPRNQKNVIVPIWNEGPKTTPCMAFRTKFHTGSLAGASGFVLTLS